MRGLSMSQHVVALNFLKRHGRAYGNNGGTSCRSLPNVGKLLSGKPLVAAASATVRSVAAAAAFFKRGLSSGRRSERLFENRFKRCISGFFRIENRREQETTYRKDALVVRRRRCSSRRQLLLTSNQHVQQARRAGTWRIGLGSTRGRV